MIVRCMVNAIGAQFRDRSIKYPLSCFRSISSDSINKQYKVRVIPALQDNYMYLLIDKVRKAAFAIDPVEPKKIFKCMEEEKVFLEAVLTTHHHADHAGGNKELSEKIKGIPIYGGDTRIDCLTTKLSHNEKFALNGTVIQCLHTPCHTSGHVCYFLESPEPICFTGDTLFIAGCGRFFEGSAEQMYNSLKILSQLPPNTKIYCGHEYTINNLKFALHVEHENTAIEARLEKAAEALKRGVPTVPSTIEDELSFNPFLRTQENSIQKFTKKTDPVSVIKTLRDLKDNF